MCSRKLNAFWVGREVWLESTNSNRNIPYLPQVSKQQSCSLNVSSRSFHGCATRHDVMRARATDDRDAFGCRPRAQWAQSSQTQFYI